MWEHCLGVLRTPVPAVRLSSMSGTPVLPVLPVLQNTRALSGVLETPCSGGHRTPRPRTVALCPGVLDPSGRLIVEPARYFTPQRSVRPVTAPGNLMSSNDVYYHFAYTLRIAKPWGSSLFLLGRDRYARTREIT
jgi:hypothetical protein